MVVRALICVQLSVMHGFQITVGCDGCAQVVDLDVKPAAEGKTWSRATANAASVSKKRTNEAPPSQGGSPLSRYARKETMHD